MLDLSIFVLVQVLKVSMSLAFNILQGIEGSTAIGVTQVVTTSVGMTDIDIRAVSGSNSKCHYQIESILI